MKRANLIIGTRGSDLALIQTRTVVELLKTKKENLEVGQKVISTSGDEGFARSPIIGTGKDAFTREIDSVLLSGEIDLAVHSLKDIANDHICKGHKFPSVKINTSYSFGLDDQEFVLSFETDYPGDFLELVMTLRSTEASKYTQLEVPIFTCVSSTIDELLQLF